MNGDMDFSHCTDREILIGLHKRIDGMDKRFEDLRGDFKTYCADATTTCDTLSKRVYKIEQEGAPVVKTRLGLAEKRLDIIDGPEGSIVTLRSRVSGLEAIKNKALGGFAVITVIWALFLAFKDQILHFFGVI